MELMKRFWTERPVLSNWVVLGVGMVIILVISAWSVGFAPMQWLALVVATLLLAGLCAWIINWE